MTDGPWPDSQLADLDDDDIFAELRFNYMCVYQRKGCTNIGCDPPAYPTADYINAHLEAYTSELGVFF